MSKELMSMNSLQDECNLLRAPSFIIAQHVARGIVEHP